jgi:hypothetical protein
LLENDMNKLTDLEICKRIAEIEGVKFIVFSGKIAADAFQVHDLFSCAHMGFTFNPLTDDALCFQLMVKHRVKIVFERAPDYYHAIALYKINNTKLCQSDESPNKAICLAIIEAHKDIN